MSGGVETTAGAKLRGSCCIRSRTQGLSAVKAFAPAYCSLILSRPESDSGWGCPQLQTMVIVQAPAEVGNCGEEPE